MTILLLIIIFAVCFAGILIADNRRFVVRSYSVRSEKIKKSYRIVYLTDLHNKVYGKDNSSVEQAVEEAGPDAVFLGGDLIIFRELFKGRDAQSHALALVRKLAARRAVYFVNGNHEQHLMEEEGTAAMYKAFEKELEEAGAVVLNNRDTALVKENESTGVRLYGAALPMDYYERFRYKAVSAAEIREYIGNPAEEEFTVLLAHTPDQAEAYAEWGADLCLCGHLHGGVARLPLIGGVIGPQTGLFPRWSAGRYQIRRKGREAAAMEMIVSCGMGMHKLPVRFLNPGELTVIDLEPGTGA